MEKETKRGLRLCDEQTEKQGKRGGVELVFLKFKGGKISLEEDRLRSFLEVLHGNHELFQKKGESGTGFAQMMLYFSYISTVTEQCRQSSVSSSPSPPPIPPHWYSPTAAGAHSLLACCS